MAQANDADNPGLGQRHPTKQDWHTDKPDKGPNQPIGQATGALSPDALQCEPPGQTEQTEAPTDEEYMPTPQGNDTDDAETGKNNPKRPCSLAKLPTTSLADNTWPYMRTTASPPLKYEDWPSPINHTDSGPFNRGTRTPAVVCTS